jgi:hypothetical protein
LVDGRFSIYRSTMGILDSIRRLFGRADDAMTEADYAAMEAVHRAEDRIDDATGGRFYDTVEKADEEAGELLERLHLDNEPGQDEPGRSDPVDDVAGQGPEAA